MTETKAVIRHPQYEAEVRSRFNEPVLTTRLEVARCIGYAEDDCDCYIILRYPTKGGTPRVVWSTMVGGYYWLTALQAQNRHKHEGQLWHDLRRLDEDLSRNGVAREDVFKVIPYSAPNDGEEDGQRFNHTSGS